MIVVVSNVWPRARFYDNVGKIGARLAAYRSDLVISRYDRIFPIENFRDVHEDANAVYAAHAEQITDTSAKHGVMSGGITEEVARQCIFFTMLLRAVLVRYAGEISLVGAYCSGIVPTLYAIATASLEDGVASLSPRLLAQLMSQDAMVTRNVTERDVVMAIVTYERSGWRDIEREISRHAEGRVYISDVKSDAVVVLSGCRGDMKLLLERLSDRVPGKLGVSRLVPHGGLHTPLAAPSGCTELDRDGSWRVLHAAMARAPFETLTSAGRSFQPGDGASGLEELVRSTLFDPVQSGRFSENLRARAEPRLFIGLPSVLFDMFVGTGLRPRRAEIVGCAHL